MQPLRVPDYATQSTRQLADTINQRICEAETAWAEGRRQADEADAKAKSRDFMTCDIDAVNDSADNLKRSEVAYLRTEIRILNDMQQIGVAINADRIGTLRKVEAEIEKTIAEIRDGLRTLGFAPFLELPDPLLQHPVDGFIRKFSVRLVPLLERQHLLQAVGGGGGNTSRLIECEKRLRKLLGIEPVGMNT